MKKALFWSMLFLTWGGVISCSDDDNDGGENTNIPRPANVTLELATGEEDEITVNQLSSFDYFVWNATAGEVLPLEGAIDGISSLGTADLSTGKLQFTLAPENGYQIYGMGEKVLEADNTTTTPAEKATRPTSDPRTAVWKTDINGELQNTDLFWGTCTASSGIDSKLTLERVVGQVSIELKEEEGITVDSIYLEMPGDKMSTAILRDGTLVCGENSESCAWKVSNLFYMLPMEEAATTGVMLHLYITTEQEEVIDRKVSLDGIGFQIKKNQCLRLILTGMTWDADGQLTSTVKPIIEWGEVIPMNVGTADIENFIPGSELNQDMGVYYHYNQLTTDAQREAYMAIVETCKAFDDAGSTLPRITIPIPIALGSTAEVTTVSNAVTRDMPSFFHLNYVQNYYTYTDWVTCRFSYPYADFAYKYKMAMKGADEILSGMPEGLSEFERAKYLWDEFLQYVSYGQLQGSADNIYGAFCIRKIVCEGYARAYQYLCQRAGIQALYCTGYAYPNGSPVNHAWNILRIDGKYYYCDPTFDDGMTAGSTTVRYDNFLKSKDTFWQQHDVSPDDPEISEEDYPLDFLYE